MTTRVNDDGPGNLGHQATHEAIVNTNTDTMGVSQQFGGIQVCLHAQPAVASTSGPRTLVRTSVTDAVTGPTDQSMTPTEKKTTPGDVPGLVQQSKLETRREKNENEFSEAYDAGMGQSTMAHAPAIGSPETFRGSRNGTVRPPISQEPTISAIRALGEKKTLQDRAGCAVRTPNYSSGETAILLDQGVKATRIPTKAALAVLLIAQCMTSGCLYLRVVLIA